MSFFYCWRKTHSKTSACRQLTTENELEKRTWDIPCDVKGIDKEVEGSGTDPGLMARTTSCSMTRDADVIFRRHAWKGESYQEGDLAKESDNSIEFLDKVDQYAFAVFKPPSPFHPSSLTPLKSCFEKDLQCPPLGLAIFTASVCWPTSVLKCLRSVVTEVSEPCHWDLGNNWVAGRREFWNSLLIYGLLSFLSIKIPVSSGVSVWGWELWRTSNLFHSVFLGYLIKTMISVLGRGKQYFVAEESSFKSPHVAFSLHQQ